MYNEKDTSEAKTVRYDTVAGTAAVMSPGSSLCNLADTERLFPQVQAQREAYEIFDFLPQTDNGVFWTAMI
jgi:hypothetical protein